MVQSCSYDVLQIVVIKIQSYVEHTSTVMSSWATLISLGALTFTSNFGRTRGRMWQLVILMSGSTTHKSKLGEEQNVPYFSTLKLCENLT